MTLTRTLIKKTAQGGKKLIRWMQTERLLARKKQCPVCNNRIKFKRTNTTKDGYSWKVRINMPLYCKFQIDEILTDYLNVDFTLAIVSFISD